MKKPSHLTGLALISKSRSSPRHRSFHCFAFSLDGPRGLSEAKIQATSVFILVYPEAEPLKGFLDIGEEPGAPLKLALRVETDCPIAVVHVGDAVRELFQGRRKRQGEKVRGAQGSLRDPTIDVHPSCWLSVDPGVHGSIRQPTVDPPDDSEACPKVGDGLGHSLSGGRREGRCDVCHNRGGVFPIPAIGLLGRLRRRRWTFQSMSN